MRRGARTRLVEGRVVVAAIPDDHVSLLLRLPIAPKPNFKQGLVDVKSSFHRLSGQRRALS